MRSVDAAIARTEGGLNNNCPIFLTSQPQICIQRIPRYTFSVITYAKWITLMSTTTQSSSTHLSTITNGILIAIMVIPFSMALALLVFSGDLSNYVAQGIGLALLSAIVSLILTALFAKTAGIIGALQGMASVIMAIVVADIASQMTNTSDTAIFVTAVAALAISTLLFGITLLVVSRLKLAPIVHSLHFPVIGGLIAGVGWLLIRGGLDVTTDNAPMSDYFDLDTLRLWLPAILFAVTLRMTMRYSDHPLILPVLVVGAIVLFYIILTISGISVSEAQDIGLLFSNLPDGSLLDFGYFGDVDQIEWKHIAANTQHIISMIAINLVLMVINLSALEVIMEEDFDMNHELRVAGTANVLSGGFGGFVSYHMVSGTTLAKRLNASNRLLPFIIAATCGVVLIFGTTILTYFPQFVLGGMLMFLGIGLLLEWLIDSLKTLPRTDLLIIWAILLTVVFFGLLEGVIIGVLASFILFILDYSRLPIFRHLLTGNDFQSSVYRPPIHEQFLEKRCGERLLIIQLQGYIFFVTSDRILERIKEHETELHHVILDCRRIIKLDSSTIYSLSKMQRFCQQNGIELILAAVPPQIAPQLEELELPTHIDVDHAVIAIEDRLIAESGLLDDTQAVMNSSYLLRDGNFGFLKYMAVEKFEAGTVIAAQGTDADSLYILENGRLSIVLEIPDAPNLRLRTIMPGVMFGEIGFYLKRTRTATIIAEEDSSVLKLTYDALQQMHKDDPNIAVKFHETLAKVALKRLDDTTTLIKNTLG